MTNGEKIRNMSDEELISFLVDIEVGGIPICKFCEIGSDYCGECLLRWLEQEAK